MPEVSVVICCANAASTLSAALASARWADEVVVVDSGSDDDTEAVARAGADRYLVEPWRGYSAQKAFGAEQARHDWVLILDGDEEVSPRLADEIRGMAEERWAAADLFWMPRLNYVMGRPVRAWSPDWQSRLIRRGRVNWGGEALHESRRAADPAREGRLHGPLLHKRIGSPGFADYFGGRRLDERLLPVAREMYARGKRVGYLGLLLRPVAAFVKFYFLRGAWLDGAFGLLIAQKAMVSVQLKYAALWAVQQEARQPNRAAPPDAAPPPAA